MVIKNSTIHGRGVFSTEFLKKGTILKCEVIEVCNTDELLHEYVYPFIGSRSCIHIGFASFLNSSKLPNLKHIKIDTVDRISYFEVIDDINDDEEITLNYL